MGKKMKKSARFVDEKNKTKQNNNAFQRAFNTKKKIVGDHGFSECSCVTETNTNMHCIMNSININIKHTLWFPLVWVLLLLLLGSYYMIYFIICKTKTKSNAFCMDILFTIQVLSLLRESISLSFVIRHNFCSCQLQIITHYHSISFVFLFFSFLSVILCSVVFFPWSLTWFCCVVCLLACLRV